jgi:predicted ATP-dependent serine protease
MDPLKTLDSASQCPNCATVHSKGLSRCPECGTFHSGVHLEERLPPPQNSREAYIPPDPSSYSLDPSKHKPDEEFEGDEKSVVNWKGGSSDFSFEEE